MDMNLRKGNSSESEWTAQAGLIGIDIANEGPISDNSDASYLINYRYSTLGLLSAMGVDLGDERIGFSRYIGASECADQREAPVVCFRYGRIEHE